MLLKERMLNTQFSHSEKKIINYILEKEELIKDYSTTMIAQETYTTSSTLIRIAKKLGYNGWIEFKNAYLEEVQYLKNHFKDIDCNIPFEDNDSIMNIASKITKLHIESAQDTLSLIHHDSLQRAIRILTKANEIKIFAVGNINYIGQEFVFKLNRIHKKASIDPIQDNMYHNALMMSPNECAICISYSGETIALLETVNILKNNQVPIIAITSYGENSLSQLANVTLNMSTREKSISKIAGFSSLESISIILDILYSCLFRLDYETNLNYKLSIAREIETNRKIKNEIIEE